MTDEVRTLALREFEFRFKPTMSAKDFGIITRFRTEGSIEGERADLFELLNGVVRRTLLREERERWDKLWDDDADFDVPITFEELSEFVNVVVESEVKRPTRSPQHSGATARTTSTPSTGNSASPEVPASERSHSVPA